MLQRLFELFQYSKNTPCKVNDRTSEMKFLQSELQEVREKYEEVCSAHNQALDLKQSYKSQVKNLENEAKLYQYKVTELQEKYKNECTAHQVDEKLKEMYKSQIKILQKGKENTGRFCEKTF